MVVVRFTHLVAITLAISMLGLGGVQAQIPGTVTEPALGAADTAGIGNETRLALRVAEAAAATGLSSEGFANPGFDGAADTDNGFALNGGAAVENLGGDHGQVVNLAVDGTMPTPTTGRAWVGEVAIFPTVPFTLDRWIEFGVSYNVPATTPDNTSLHQHIVLDLDDDEVADLCLSRDAASDVDADPTTDWMADTTNLTTSYTMHDNACDNVAESSLFGQIPSDTADVPAARPLALWLLDPALRAAKVLHVDLQVAVDPAASWDSGAIYVDDATVAIQLSPTDFDGDGYSNVEEFGAAPFPEGLYQMFYSAGTPSDWDGDGFLNGEEDRNGDRKVDADLGETDPFNGTDHPRPAVTITAEATSGAGPTFELGETITFSSTIDYAPPVAPPGASIVRTTWLLDGVEVASGASFQHTFSDFGSAEVTFEVEENHGVVVTEGLDIRVPSTPPTVSPTITVTETGLPALEVFTFDNLTFDGTDVSDVETPDDLTCLWALGEGNSTSDCVVKWDYKDDAMYTPCLTVTDAHGDATTVCREVVVLNQRPTAVFNIGAADPGRIIAEQPASGMSLPGPLAEAGGQLVEFNSTGSGDEDGQEAPTLSWDFGDGNTASGPNVTHRYATGAYGAPFSETYTVTLSVTDDDNVTETFSMDLTVFDNHDDDLIPDVEDTDDDNDGFSDAEELGQAPPSDPADPASTPGDVDGDGIPNALDWFLEDSALGPTIKMVEDGVGAPEQLLIDGDGDGIPGIIDPNDDNAEEPVPAAPSLPLRSIDEDTVLVAEGDRLDVLSGGGEHTKVVLSSPDGTTQVINVSVGTHALTDLVGHPADGTWVIHAGGDIRANLVVGGQTLDINTLKTPIGDAPVGHTMVWNQHSGQRVVSTTSPAPPAGADAMYRYVPAAPDVPA